MPERPAKPCANYPKCTSLVRGSRFCEPCRKADSRARLSPSKRGYDRHWNEVVRPRILRRDPICKCKGCPRCTHPRTNCVRWSRQADHIIPKNQGGTDDDANIQGLCDNCHSYKTATEDRQWSPSRRRKVNAAPPDKALRRYHEFH